MACSKQWHEDAAWARAHKNELSALRVRGRALKVISPCVGIDAPQRACRELGVEWESAGDFDTNIALRGVLTSLAGEMENECGHIHVGQRGNVLHVSKESLSLDADAVVAGLPCPPFSDMGNQLAASDPRASVFFHVCDWITHLATHGQLSFFVIENVPGITKRRRGSEETFANTVVAYFQKHIPSWEVAIRKWNAKACGVPQDRGRVFFVGTAPTMRAARSQLRVLRQPFAPQSVCSLLSVLDKTACDSDWMDLTLRQQCNVLAQLDAFEARRQTLDDPPAVGIIDACRDTLLRVDSDACLDSTRTLRTNCGSLWIVPGLEFRSTFGQHGRKLNRVEKCRCAGLVDTALDSLSPIEVDRAVGNTIPVPLMGTVLAPLLKAFAFHVRITEESS